MAFKNKEDQRAYQARWYAANKSRVRRRVKRKRTGQDYATVRDDAFRRKYGMSLGERTALWEAQGRKCAICEEPIPERGQGTHTDHDHKTGRVRGILCRLCNTGLGKFTDSPERLRAAAVYLEQHAVKSVD